MKAEIAIDLFLSIDRYIIKATTYEIGILADVPDSDNATVNGSITNQQVDLSFYDTESNDTHINFGDIPLPVQTNVSGQIITGKSKLLSKVQSYHDFFLLLKESHPFTLEQLVISVMCSKPFHSAVRLRTSQNPIHHIFISHAII